MIALLLAHPLTAGQLTQAFPYQGALSNGGVPASGAYYFEFALYDDAEAGQQVGPTLSFEEVPVAHGVFTVGLDFGEGVFNGRRLWLETRAGNDALTSPTVLLPRRELMATPYALYSLDSARVGGVDAGQIATLDNLADQTPAPVAIVRASTRLGYIGGILSPPRIFFDYSSSYDPAGGALQYSIDGIGDGAIELQFANFTDWEYNYQYPGRFLTTGWARNSAGRLGFDRIPVEIRSGGGMHFPDVSGTAGHFPSMQEVAGAPALAYYDFVAQDLKFVRALNPTGSAWASPVTVTSTGNVGQHASLAVVEGRPAIAYYDQTNNQLRYVRALDATGSAWGTPVTVDNVTAQWMSMLVVDQNPAIAYYENFNQNLKYARALNSAGTAWDTPLTVDSTGSVGRYASMAIVSNRPAIAYADNAGALRYVRAFNNSGSSWQTPVEVFSTGLTDSIRYTSMAIVNFRPAIAFSYSGIKYVESSSSTGFSWLDPVNVSSSGLDCRLIQVDNYPAIVHRGGFQGRLTYRFRRPGSTFWNFYEPDTPSTTGGTPSVALGFIDGAPAVAYYDPNVARLKFLR